MAEKKQHSLATASGYASLTLPGVSIYEFEQDSQNARFHLCFFPYISYFPAVVAICILVGRGLQPFLPNRPTWATPFAKEFGQKGSMISPQPKTQSARGTTLLLVFSLGGLVLHLVTVFHPHFSTLAVAPTITSVINLSKRKESI